MPRSMYVPLHGARPLQAACEAQVWGGLPAAAARNDRRAQRAEARGSAAAVPRRGLGAPQAAAVRDRLRHGELGQHGSAARTVGRAHAHIRAAARFALASLAEVASTSACKVGQVEAKAIWCDVCVSVYYALQSARARTSRCMQRAHTARSRRGTRSGCCGSTTSCSRCCRCTAAACRRTRCPRSCCRTSCSRARSRQRCSGRRSRRRSRRSTCPWCSIRRRWARGRGSAPGCTPAAPGRGAARAAFVSCGAVW
jgi:hypothetical protein